jgi:hypothetical protein
MPSTLIGARVFTPAWAPGSRLRRSAHGSAHKTNAHSVARPIVGTLAIANSARRILSPAERHLTEACRGRSERSNAPAFAREYSPARSDIRKSHGVRAVDDVSHDADRSRRQPAIAGIPAVPALPPRWIRGWPLRVVGRPEGLSTAGHNAQRTVRLEIADQPAGPLAIAGWINKLEPELGRRAGRSGHGPHRAPWSGVD